MPLDVVDFNNVRLVVRHDRKVVIDILAPDFARRAEYMGAAAPGADLNQLRIHLFYKSKRVGPVRRFLLRLLGIRVL